MDEVDLRIAAMEKELTELRAMIDALGERLGQGENAVRADLNPAIRREHELSSELHDLKVSSGRLTPEDLRKVQVMYGPPWQFSTRHERPPAPMYGPPPVGFKQRVVQEDDAAHRPDGPGKLPRIWRRLFRRE